MCLCVCVFCFALCEWKYINLETCKGVFTQPGLPAVTRVAAEMALAQGIKHP